MLMFKPNTDNIKNFRDKGLFLMAWRFSLAFSILFTILAISFSFYSPMNSMSYVPIAVISIGSLFHLKKTYNPVPTFWVLALAGTVVSQATLYVFPKLLPYSNFTWIIAGVVFTYVALGRKPGIYFLILNIIGFIIYFFVGLDNHLEQIQPLNLTGKINVALEIVASMAVVGYLMNQYQVYQTYTRLQLRKLNLHLEQQNDAIITKNKENITLVKEVHHRVKNNLQIIISLLRMQRSQVKSAANKKHFDDMINRVMTMSMIHQRLYQEKEVSRINIQEYLQELAIEIQSLSDGAKNVKFNITSSVEFVDLKTIVPLGLLINELISNSVKHAFKNEGDNSVNICIEDGFKLTYKDNGTWIEKGKMTDSYGIELIDVLTEQLNGEYTRENSEYIFKLNPDLG